MIEPTFDDVGRTVRYTGNRYPGGKIERGKITGLTALGVFVRYEGDRHAKSTLREDLEWDDAETGTISRPHGAGSSENG
jgi:hypothetical protein